MRISYFSLTLRRFGGATAGGDQYCTAASSAAPANGVQEVDLAPTSTATSTDQCLGGDGGRTHISGSIAMAEGVQQTRQIEIPNGEHTGPSAQGQAAVGAAAGPFFSSGVIANGAADLLQSPHEENVRCCTGYYVWKVSSMCYGTGA